MQEINTWPGWESVRQIGSGSFGKVYEIEREEFGKTYKAALKVITVPQHESDLENAYDEGMDEQSVTDYFRGFVENITDEFALMSEMRGNSNVVSYEDHMIIPHKNKIGWDIIIRMELLTPLPEWNKNHPLSELDVIKLGCDICHALELCRVKNIVHRDIKPDNIFVNDYNDYKLGDFGIARTMEKTVSNMSKKGTYSYMAPEVYLGQSYGATVDIYSLGTVLYRFLNENRTPFLPMGVIKFTDREEALTKRMSGLPIPPPAHGSEKLKAVVLKAIAFRPEDRYRSATEFFRALESCLPEAYRKPSVAMEKEENTMILSSSDNLQSVNEPISQQEHEMETTGTLLLNVANENKLSRGRILPETVKMQEVEKEEPVVESPQPTIENREEKKDIYEQLEKQKSLTRTWIFLALVVAITFVLAFTAPAWVIFLLVLPVTLIVILTKLLSGIAIRLVSKKDDASTKKSRMTILCALLSIVLVLMIVILPPFLYTGDKMTQEEKDSAKEVLDNYVRQVDEIVQQGDEEEYIKYDEALESIFKTWKEGREITGQYDKLTGHTVVKYGNIVEVEAVVNSLEKDTETVVVKLVYDSKDYVIKSLEVRKNDTMADKIGNGFFKVAYFWIYLVM